MDELCNNLANICANKYESLLLNCVRTPDDHVLPQEGDLNLLLHDNRERYVCVQEVDEPERRTTFLLCLQTGGVIGTDYQSTEPGQIYQVRSLMLCSDLPQISNLISEQKSDCQPMQPTLLWVFINLPNNVACRETWKLEGKNTTLQKTQLRGITAH